MFSHLPSNKAYEATMRSRTTKLFATLLIATLLMVGFGCTSSLTGPEPSAPASGTKATASTSRSNDFSARASNNNFTNSNDFPISIIGPTHVQPNTPTTYTAEVANADIKDDLPIDYRYDWQKSPSDIEDAPIGQHFGVVTNGGGEAFILSVTATHKTTRQAASTEIRVWVSNNGEQGRCVGPPYPYPCENYP